MLLPQTKTLTLHQEGDLVYCTFPSLSRIDGICHAFSTRLGGVSNGYCESMNLSFSRGDDPMCVAENFRRQCAAIGATPDQVVLTKQTHTANVRVVTKADAGNGVTRPQQYEDVDGLVTNEAGVVLCTQHADCVPLYFVDPVERVIGLSHAGWKGTVSRIAAVTVETMHRRFGSDPGNIIAGIGPSIGRCCFEVDTPVFEVFSSECPEFDTACYTKRGEKYDLDLWEINRRIMMTAGVTAAHITVTDLCTKCHPTVFWSHRVTGANRGSLAAFLGLK